ncbi:MAG: TolC family outer membrane protein [Burkholderiales bacterium]
MKNNRLPFAIALLAAACQWASAQTGEPMREAVQQALSTNPEVTARLNALRAAVDEVDVARGAYYPRVDLNAEASRTRDRLTNRSPAEQTMNTSGVALSATQLLWDGLGTVNQVQRFDHARLTRYFEFLDASDQTALEATRAYVDVVRERELVRLAEDNYVQHRQVVDQIQSRVNAGVGRGVDLEQANARLALAETNLATETSNLHDVNERYRRVVGTAPPMAMPLPRSLDQGLPSTAAAALDLSARRNATVAAAVENLRATQNLTKERQSPFQPRVEAVVRAAGGRNLDGIASQQRDTSAGLRLSWNLFAGGADRARVRQSVNLLSVAADQRDTACRNVRQTAAIAYNDTRKLFEQLGYLERNVQASVKARDAYRQQFDIGQRSLLDVLNAESELFNARRALANANHDLLIAKARTQAAATQLVGNLGLTRAGGADGLPDGAAWSAGDDAASRCPTAPNDLRYTSKAELDARARGITVRNEPTAVPSPVTSPVAAPLVLAPLPTAAAAPVPVAQPAPAAAPGTPLSQRLLDWNAAWSRKDFDAYSSFYDGSFKPPQAGRAKWLDGRAQVMKQSGPIDLKISNIQRRSLSPDLVEVQFDQNYAWDSYKATTHKVMQWKRVGSDWVIVKESSR